MEKIILIADKDGTEIYKDGGLTEIIDFRRGQHFILISQVRIYHTDYQDNMYISTQDPFKKTNCISRYWIRRRTFLWS